MSIRYCAFLSDESLLTQLNVNASRLIKVFTVLKLTYKHTVFTQGQILDGRTSTLVI